MKYWNRAWQLVGGCSPCSPGCRGCWSAAAAHVRQYQENKKIREQYEGLTFKRGGFPTFNGTIRLFQDRLDIPFHRRKPTVYCIWNDLFHGGVPERYIDEAYAMMALCNQHTFLVLTKRAARMAQYWSQDRVTLGTRWLRAARHRKDGSTIPATQCGRWPVVGFPNVWHGLTVCNQEEANAKIPVFLQVPGRLFLSIEPMLGPIDLDETCGPSWCWRDGAIQSIIVGGETGHGARPMHPDWVRKVRDDCAAVGVPFLFKQWGGRNGGRLLDGCEHNNMSWRTA